MNGRINTEGMQGERIRLPSGRMQGVWRFRLAGGTRFNAGGQTRLSAQNEVNNDGGITVTSLRALLTS
ncbi:hypothetical protein SMATCC274_20460 [Serratia marcescens]|nr:hypothetical protein SMATCC274_20460 [Serratia marcescens]